MFIENDLWWHIRRAARLEHYSGFNDHPTTKMFRSLVYKEDFGVVDFDVTLLDGLNANNSDWGHISDFAFRNFQHDYDGGRAIRFSTDADFENNKRTFADALLNPTAYVKWCEWSGRSYLINSGRGHHTAAIYRQCMADGRSFTFPARLEALRIDREVIRLLAEQYWIVVCDSETALWASGVRIDYENESRWADIWATFDLDSKRWFDCEGTPTVLFLRRASFLFPVVREWLLRSPTSFWDLTAWLNSYLPVPRNDPKDASVQRQPSKSG